MVANNDNYKKRLLEKHFFQAALVEDPFPLPENRPPHPLANKPSAEEAEDPPTVSPKKRRGPAPSILSKNERQMLYKRQNLDPHFWRCTMVEDKKTCGKCVASKDYGLTHQMKDHKDEKRDHLLMMVKCEFTSFKDKIKFRYITDEEVVGKTVLCNAI